MAARPITDDPDYTLCRDRGIPRIRRDQGSMYQTTQVFPLCTFVNTWALQAKARRCEIRNF